MGSLLNFVLARDSYRVVVEQSVPEVVARFGVLVGLPQSARQLVAGRYTGKVSESGFVVRRVAVHGKDTRASVVTRGQFESEGEATGVRVTVRHGRHMVFFTWLLFLMACSAAGSSDPGFWLGAALIAGLALLLHVKLYMDVRRVGDEVRALLTSY